VSLPGESPRWDRVGGVGDYQQQLQRQLQLQLQRAERIVAAGANEESYHLWMAQRQLWRRVDAEALRATTCAFTSWRRVAETGQVTRCLVQKVYLRCDNARSLSFFLLWALHVRRKYQLSEQLQWVNSEHAALVSAMALENTRCLKVTAFQTWTSEVLVHLVMQLNGERQQDSEESTMRSKCDRMLTNILHAWAVQSVRENHDRRLFQVTQRHDQELADLSGMQVEASRRADSVCNEEQRMAARVVEVEERWRARAKRSVCQLRFATMQAAWLTWQAWRQDMHGKITWLHRLWP